MDSNTPAQKKGNKKKTMENKKWIAAICCGTLLLSTGIPGTSRQAQGASQPKEYIIQTESDRTYEKISKQYEDEIKKKLKKKTLWKTQIF